MKRILVVLLSLLLFPGMAAQAVSLSDIELPESVMVDGTRLVLNGSGLRKKFFLKLYLGALYLPEKSHDAKAIVEGDDPVDIHLHIISRFVTANKMKNGIKEGFEASTGGNTAPIEHEINQFLAMFADGVSEDDIFDITWAPDKGVVVQLNGRILGEITSNRKAFRKALVGIWLGDKPAQEDLKKGMLGL